MLWLVPLAVALVGMLWLRRLARALDAEVPAARAKLDWFTGEVRPALVRVRDETTRARLRNPHDEI
ncbi:MAG TPA: hypothetical protein VFR41_11715 [Acidimicrobiia bacterium]|nr:hypothetical protein [Acidimicrobiia bacterium]